MRSAVAIEEVRTNAARTSPARGKTAPHNCWNSEDFDLLHTSGHFLEGSLPINGDMGPCEVSESWPIEK